MINTAKQGRAPRPQNFVILCKMVQQYPDTIVVTIKGNPYKGSDGNYHAPTGSDIAFHIWGCRAEPNSAGRKLSGPDGALLDYSFTIYMPKTSVVVPFGATFVLTKGAMTVTGKVKGGFNGQFNSRLWL